MSNNTVSFSSSKSVTIPKVTLSKKNINVSLYDLMLPEQLNYKGRFDKNIDLDLDLEKNKLHEYTIEELLAEGQRRKELEELLAEEQRRKERRKEVEKKAAEGQETRKERRKEAESEFISNLRKEVSKKKEINDSGKITDFTDYQNIFISLIKNIQDPKIYKKYEGKTIYEMYENIYNSTSKDIDLDKIKVLIDNGLGDFCIEEIVDGKDGFGSVVLSDVDGNYLICFPPTNTNETGDKFFDAKPLLDEIAPEFLNGEFNNLIKEFTKIDSEVFDEINDTYYSQINQSKELAIKYYKKAQEENKKVNFHGYSLGGSLAEEAYLSCLKESIFDAFKNTTKAKIVAKFENFNSFFNNYFKSDNNLSSLLGNTVVVVGKYMSNFAPENLINYAFNLYKKSRNCYINYKKDFKNLLDDVVDNLILFNPYHLSDYQSAKKVNDYEKLKLYSSEGDLVSAIFNQNVFYNKTNFIETDWKTLYDEVIGEGRFIEGKLGTIVDVIKSINKIKKGKAEKIALLQGASLDEIFNHNNANLDEEKITKYFEAISAGVSGPHSLSSVLTSSFNEDGSLKDTGADITDNPTKSEILKYLVNDKNAIKTLRKEVEKIINDVNFKAANKNPELTKALSNIKSDTGRYIFEWLKDFANDYH